MNEPTNLSEWLNYIHEEANNPQHELSSGDYKKPFGHPNYDLQLTGFDLKPQLKLTAK